MGGIKLPTQMIVKMAQKSAARMKGAGVALVEKAAT